MGISYKNGSGCPDPTAYYAVQHMKRKKRGYTSGIQPGRWFWKSSVSSPVPLQKQRNYLRCSGGTVKNQKRKNCGSF